MTNGAARDERRRLEASLELDQQELGRAVVELTEAARDAVAPSGMIARRPYPWILGAFALGAWLGQRRGEAAGD